MEPFFPVEKTIATTRLLVMIWLAGGDAPPHDVALIAGATTLVLQTSRSFGWHAMP